jgi:hypothetical protein
MARCVMRSVADLRNTVVTTDSARNNHPDVTAPLQNLPKHLATYFHKFNQLDFIAPCSDTTRNLHARKTHFDF